MKSYFYRHVFYLMAFAVVLCGRLHSQPIIGIDLLQERGSTEIPFEMEQGFIVVKLWLGGIIPLRMIFDTGAENTIIFDKQLTQLIGIPFERQIPIMGSDLDSVLIANIARNVVLRLDGTNVVKRDVIVLEENNLLINEKLGVDINGIIGGGYFPNVVARIDYRRGMITLRHPKDFKKPKSYQEFEIDIIGNKPYMSVDINIQGRKIPITVLLDTGAALPFLVHTNTDSLLQLPEKVMLGNVGYGLAGVLRGYMGKSEKLEIGEFQFDQLITSFQDIELPDSVRRSGLIRNGIVGNNLLSRFFVIIDYSKERLYLKPTRKYNKDFEYDKSGLTVFAVGSDLDQYIIVSVLPGSPAEAIDIRPGDIIKRIGMRKAKNMTLQAITNKFAKKEGKKVKMVIDRDGVLLKKTLVLRSWDSPLYPSSLKKSSSKVSVK